jgi:hypothetical protein
LLLITIVGIIVTTFGAYLTIAYLTQSGEARFAGVQVTLPFGVIVMITGIAVIIFPYTPLYQDTMNTPPIGTTPTTTTTTTLDPQSLVKYEQLVKEELRQGHVVYNPPRRMRLGQTKQIEVRLTRQFTSSAATSLSGGGPPLVEEVPIATRMKAELTGEAFRIEAHGNPAVQRIGREGYRSWIWSLTPTKSGKQYLNLTIYALLPEEGSEEPLDHRVFSRTIEVDVSPVQSVMSWLGINWDKVLAALGITGIGIFGAIKAVPQWVRRRRQRKIPGAHAGQTQQASGDQPQPNDHGQQKDEPSKPASTVHPHRSDEVTTRRHERQS